MITKFPKIDLLLRNVAMDHLRLKVHDANMAHFVQRIVDSFAKRMEALRLKRDL